MKTILSTQDNYLWVQPKTQHHRAYKSKGILIWSHQRTPLFFCFSFFLTMLILLLFDHVEFCDWAVIKKMFLTHQLHSLVAQQGPTSHPLFSISLVYTPFFWRSCCLTLPVSGNRPSYSLDFRPLVPHQWQLTSRRICKALCSVSWIPIALWCSASTY